MPNWCQNSVTISGSKEQVDEFEQFLVQNDGKDWFDFFNPTPEELKTVDAAAWYEWNIENWGTKWNCNAQDWVREENTISFWFDSAWGPPIALYEFAENVGFTVYGQYHEEGMQFVGEFLEGADRYYEYDTVESLDEIPQHLVDEYFLRETLLEREEYEEEDEEFEVEDDSDDVSLFEDEEDEQ